MAATSVSNSYAKMSRDSETTSYAKNVAWLNRLPRSLLARYFFGSVDFDSEVAAGAWVVSVTTLSAAK